MYLLIGTNVLVPVSEMIACIAYQGSEGKRKKNKCFLEQRIKDGAVIDIDNLMIENLKSIMLMNHNRVYLSPISPQTLYKRCKKIELSEGLK